MKCKLGDYIRIKHGFAFKGEYITAENNGVVLVTPGNFEIGGGFKEDKCKFFNGDYPKEYVLSPYDLIVTMTDLSKQGDTLGYSALVPKTNRVYLHNQRIGLVDVYNPKADKMFIYWLMRTQKYQKTIVATSSGSTVKHTSPSRIYDVEVDLPPIDVQKKIAAILSALDEKIAINRAINDNLINTTDTIFFKVFLENKPTATISFTDIVQLMGGGTPKTDEDSFWNGNILFFTPKDISRSPFCISTEKHLTNEGLNNCSSRLYPPYTTFVTCRGTVGNLALAGVPMAMNQSCYALKGKNDFPALFVFSFTRYVIATMKKKASGAVFSALVTRDFEMEKVFEPNFEDAILFEKRVEPLFAQILANTNEIQQLLDLQNALLTQLSSR